MTPGVAGYPGQFGNVLIKKESFDKFINTMVGVPVIINHKDITAKNANDERVGVVSNVWFDDKDGWYWCDGVIWDETAQNLITDKGWSVSCSYDVKLADDAGGTENNIPYDIEFLDGVFTHLAIVDNPRYERANIVFNSKTVVQNYNQNQPRVPKGNSNGGQFAKNTVDLTNYFTSTPTMKEVKEFLNKMVEEGKEFATSSPDWFVDIPSSSRKKDHIAKSSQFQRMNKSQKNRHNKYVMALEDLLGSAQYLNPSPNKKPLEKPNTQKYHYFISEVKIGDKTYKILFDTEEYKGDSTIKPQTVHLYDVKEVKNSSLSANVQPSVKNLKEESNNIIPDNHEDFNPMIKNNVQNWNEADHPRDEAGKFTEKGKAARKTQANYGREVRLKDGNKTGIIIGSVPHGDDPDTGEEMFLYEIKWDNGEIERIHSNKVDLTIDLKELEKEIDDNPQSWMTPRNLERIKKQKSSQESNGWTREEMEDYYRSSIAGDDFSKKWEYAKSHPWRDLTKAQNNKEQDMALLDELKKLITKVENDKGENMDENEVKNEKVDKRKLIDEVAGIMKSAGADDEKIRTAIAKMEKLAYDKSEAGTADNEKEDDPKSEKDTADNKKVKNEETKEDKKKYDDLKKDVKEDSEAGAKGTTASENKCKNSVDNSKGGYFDKMNEIYNSAIEPAEENTYISREQKLKYAEEYFAK